MTGCERNLSLALLSLVEDAGMPDSYWATDGRVALARRCLGLSDEDRYSRKFARMLDRYDARRHAA